MLGLPTFTAAVIIGITLLWIVYTAVFWVVSKDWHLADETPAQEGVA
ncbi:hypothetical protein NQ015_07130 [Corynebacterium sp. 153RC1]|nr:MULTISPECIES: hypothetical protein [unclassified Corynebacterium]MCQ9370466.1 hypothetical protein [Corynebacterium sp. 35RC1]MCQ9342989.1 hypothetical protein [Corynebacterium sp. 76QC2CO]MCQ9352704.1 hypothetical protein [Corynebacterium sp. 209RC1]MCQ9354888.1 hypothetical protein [Corynebacterium sp. 1222RC1]MCQ9357073.1 hypothetical protein [Corynebacterium sp. 122RC1]